MMPAPTPNLPLLRKAVEWAEAEAAKPNLADSEWYQAAWSTPAPFVGRSCGTCYCIAGWVCHTVDGFVDDRDAAYRAAELLGIDVVEHTYSGLFNATNSIEDVRRHAEQIAASAGERL